MRFSYSLFVTGLSVALLLPGVGSADRENSELWARIAALEEAVANLQSTLGSDVADLQSIVAVLEGDITNLDASISSHVSNTGNAHDHDSRYVRDSGENLRVIRGLVNADGSIFGTPSGYHVTKGGTGEYAITYDEGFPSVPATAVHILVSNGTRYKTGSFSSPSSLKFTVRDANGNAVDTTFDFIVIGKQ